MRSSILEMLFTPFAAVFFAVVLAVCVFLMIKKRANKTALLIIIGLCLVYLLFVVYLSIGFGQDIPTIAPPAPPK